MSRLACGGCKPGRLHRPACMHKNGMNVWNVSIATINLSHYPTAGDREQKTHFIGYFGQ